MIGELLNMRVRTARVRASELLDWFDLEDAADRMAKTYSGGMRRRLDLAASLKGHPEIVFLDEPNDSVLADVVGRLRAASIEVTELSLMLPSLDEVFFTLTGERNRIAPGASDATEEVNA